MIHISYLKHKKNNANVNFLKLYCFYCYNNYFSRSSYCLLSVTQTERNGWLQFSSFYTRKPFYARSRRYRCDLYCNFLQSFSYIQVFIMKLYKCISGTFPVRMEININLFIALTFRLLNM